ncbi:acyl carrier protein [Streptomyces sp. NPDC048484]|uniref:acyl carrier protein n=1 Tax=Streptomyces sp. NPDC048484 TaxID=3155146 RepID=UPI00341A82B0
MSAKLGVPEEDIHPDATFEDLEVDSLAIVELSDVIEGQYGVTLEDGQVTKRTTMARTAELLAAQEQA